MRVLLAEDEPDLARVMKLLLEEEGYACDWVADGESALHQARTVAYDAVLLDLMLPGRDGWSVLRTLRAEDVGIPVLVVTARDALPEKVKGLDLGADDYLTKPFAIPELLARLRALIRRGAHHPSPVLTIGDLLLDTRARSVTVAGRAVELRAKEYALLELLAYRQGEVLSRAAILEHLYDDEDETLSNVIEVYVAALRKKLGRDVIETRRGQGYRLP